MGAEVCQLCSIGSPACRLKGKGDLRVAYIKRAKKRLMMDERGVIDIKRDLAKKGKRVFAILVVENTYDFCDQSAVRIQRHASYVLFNTVVVELHYDSLSKVYCNSTLSE